VGLFAILLTYLLQMTGRINSFLDRITLIETRMVSLERCIDFTNIAPEEGYKNLKELEENIKKGNATIRGDLSKEWPTIGSIDFKNIKIRYRKNLNNVIKGINLKIEGGTKIGLVGRTGAGKTTLLTSIYGSFSDFEGEIIIDGKEIRTIDLKQLRGSISVIPQDPYLFQDTLRNNLDPLGLRKTKEILNLVKEIGLWEKVEPAGGLEFKVESGGKNLSQGEKQLVCLARAFLMENKIVLLDEATSNIDQATEDKIQSMIKEMFKTSTVVMIAHRLNTIMHCDKYIFVNSQGSSFRGRKAHRIREYSISKVKQKLNIWPNGDKKR